MNDNTTIDTGNTPDSGVQTASIVLNPSEENALSRVLEFVEESLNGADVPMKVVFKMNIAVDEIFSNIVYYSGATSARIACSISTEGVELTFADNGKPYNPLEAEEPDTALSAEDREIGGLGIFMVRKSMDRVDYEFQDGLNVLTLYKGI